MTVSQQFVAYVAEPTDVQAVLKKQIAKAMETNEQVNFFAMAPLRHEQEGDLFKVIKRVLAETNSRQGADWIVRESSQYRFFVALRAGREYTVDIATQIQGECNRIPILTVGSFMYVPAGGALEDKAQEVYSCLSSGMDDHRRKLPWLYPKEFN